MVRVCRETGPLLCHERHCGGGEEESDSAHGRGTSNLQTRKESSVAAEAGGATLCRAHGRGIKTL